MMSFVELKGEAEVGNMDISRHNPTITKSILELEYVAQEENPQENEY